MIMEKRSQQEIISVLETIRTQLEKINKDIEGARNLFKYVESEKSLGTLNKKINEGKSWVVATIKKIDNNIKKL